MAGRHRRPTDVVDVFVSHSSRDRAFVKRIVAVLRRHGISCWYAPSDILGAQQWQDEIGRALKQCNWFLLVLKNVDEFPGRQPQCYPRTDRVRGRPLIERGLHTCVRQA